MKAAAAEKAAAKAKAAAAAKVRAATAAQAQASAAAKAKAAAAAKEKAAAAAKARLVAAIPVPTCAVPKAAGSAMTPQDAVDSGADNAASSLGARTYAVVIDRSTGDVVAQTADADTQVASESLVKLFIAAAKLVQYDGRMNAGLASDMYTMITKSDDAIADVYFSSDQVTTIAERYGLENTASGSDRWGATEITARDMARFLWRMSQDPVVGPWLLNAMDHEAPTDTTGFDQSFGFNALDGVHGSKQGWGSDNWGDQANAVHSMGFTDCYLAVVLQTGGGGTYYALQTTATYTARLIQESAER